MGLFDFLNKKTVAEAGTGSLITPVLPEQVYKVAEMQLKDIIAPSALEIQPKALNLGTTVVRSFFVISYPRYLTDKSDH
jgi:hypothetical protein